MISALHSALVAPLEIVCYHSPEQDLKNKKRTQLSKHKYKLQVFLRLQTQTCASKSKLSIRVNSMIFSRRLKWKTGRQSKKRNTDKLSDEMSDEMREGRRVDLKKRQGIPSSSAADTCEMFSTFSSWISIYKMTPFCTQWFMITCSHVQHGEAPPPPLPRRTQST